MGAAGMTQGYSCIWRSFEDICSGYHQFGDELKVKESLVDQPQSIRQERRVTAEDHSSRLRVLARRAANDLPDATDGGECLQRIQLGGQVR